MNWKVVGKNVETEQGSLNNIILIYQNSLRKITIVGRCYWMLLCILVLLKTFSWLLKNVPIVVDNWTFSIKWISWLSLRVLYQKRKSYMHNSIGVQISERTVKLFVKQWFIYLTRRVTMVRNRNEFNYVSKFQEQNLTCRAI